ncbi:CcoQ/FixQ family Cbb3-type cytochrome c oxidase assembly chaperone [Colwellia sp. MB3u-28]|uniref:cbb3-type cytochrome oxidase subunit 3 n=1 Tax=unclassified Colwellia TaxID=196834 RepID=UPI0015F6ABE5|nr:MULTISPECIES: CcoQ/FixQ family Cbb3-type cytochrome c oxidase assembly chaperone [unclassified Colwellia]MBA6233906.1 CcoQ/FixQ family Cbb3-type cytochrome c oxidase assembly chaperone [Colwellia sp. MB02u-7]MBA6237620.1 CcoQ/FixQ family Cbb3-type cytochrome c oxidase assembly chaperone [Colwellia sp. MB02u-11]MBA6256045.1 CcoQ/FixQ family Cbb3-type cytochrome c oxidase assembly chaperone [Colwellia sp. MB3u-28]MBA6259982.1 CcoQ/FixQ family Cbb3-type cytochrome c oxidase assembly chaperone [
MDYGTLRGLIALLILALFIIIVVWSYSKKRKNAFDEAANSIFEEDKEKTELSDVNSKQESNKNV